MILQALDKYYERMVENPDAAIPLQGFSMQKIHFALVLNLKGELIDIWDLRVKTGKRLSPKMLAVPEPAKKSVNIVASFLWGNTGYVLGVDSKKNTERSKRTFSAFHHLCREIGESIQDPAVNAILAFLAGWEPESFEKLKYSEEMLDQNLVFNLEGEREYIHERQAVRTAWLQYHFARSSMHRGMCLVKGEVVPIARLHPDIKGVRGAQPKGASIVSFNLPAFTSYQKQQSYNASVSEEAAFNYTTALNQLLLPDSHQKVQIGDATTVFWSERPSAIEGFLGLVFDPRETQGDLAEIRLFLKAVRQGKLPPAELSDPSLKFYILGLSPNASRLSVRFWHVSTIEEMARKLGQHFADLHIQRNFDNEPEFPGIWQLLRETAVQRKSENISPLLGGAVMRSILTGAPYPQNLLSATLCRIRADQDINYLRAAIIKACLVRKARVTHTLKEVAVSLDEKNHSPAYLLGRLFAVLEKAQKDAIPEANTSIKDRYFGSASATPRSVFPVLLRLSQHHIQKAKYGQVSDKRIEEIMCLIKEFPAHLSLEDQGLFALGYYHQRQAFFMKNPMAEEKEV